MKATSLGSASIVSAAPDHLSSKLGPEVVILNLNSGVYFGLDPVGARVWELIQESNKSLSAIRDQIVGEFEVESDQCEKDLKDLLASMEVEGLIHIKTPA